MIEIDPVKVGEAEVGWWKAHNEHDKSKMAELIFEEHMALYGFTLEEAMDASSYLVKAASYHDSRDWEKAIESVTGYYQKIKEKTGLKYDCLEMAELEIGWWKLHDELEFNTDKTELANAFSKLYATEFGIDINKMTKAGKIKAFATQEHDLAEDPNTKPNEVNEHWDLAKHLLINFYEELKNNISI
jgi:hypothetical protein